MPTSKEIMGDACIYFKNGSIQELAQRLDDATKIDWQIKSDEALLVAKKFNIENIINQWKELIEK